MHNDFTLFPRTYPNGKKVVFYHAYGEDGIRLGPWSTHCLTLPVYCDPAGGERIQEITGGTKANNSVESGIDYINAKIERKQFYVCENCNGILSEIWGYCRNEAGEIVKVNDHFMDALRYAIFSDIQQGVIFA